MVVTVSSKLVVHAFTYKGISLAHPRFFSSCGDPYEVQKNRLMFSLCSFRVMKLMIYTCALNIKLTVFLTSSWKNG